MAEITIRGAGIFGLSIAWACVSRGARVQMVDPHGVGAGSSGGIVGALAPHVPENWNPKKAFQFESLCLAEGFWADIAAAGGLDPGYLRSGRLQPVADDAARLLAKRRAETARDLWEGRYIWDVVPETSMDWAPHSASGWLIHDTLSALLHPRQACEALAAALAVRGVAIKTDAPDQGCVVWATGLAGLETLNAKAERPVGSGIKGQAALLRHDARGQPQIFADGIHIIPHLDGTVAVGSTTERDYACADQTDHLLEEVITAARHAVPALAEAPVIRTWAGVRPRARSRAPMLGAWPGRPGHFVANGGFKIGFGMAPKVAEVMADLVLEDRWSIPEGFEVAASF